MTAAFLFHIIASVLNDLLLTLVSVFNNSLHSIEDICIYVIYTLIYIYIYAGIYASFVRRTTAGVYTLIIQSLLTHLFPPLRSTFAVRETASLGIMGEPRVPPLNPSESIVL